MLDETNYKIDDNNSLLILDDDQPFLKRLSVAMEKRGFNVWELLNTVIFEKSEKTKAKTRVKKLKIVINSCTDKVAKNVWSIFLSKFFEEIYDFNIKYTDTNKQIYSE